MSHAMPSGFTLLNEPPNVAYLDARLDLRKRMPAYMARSWHYSVVPPIHLRYWCHLRARYCIPTFELVSWLSNIIGGRKTIEIGAGMGDLGLAMGIPMTDSAVQVGAALDYYRAIGCPPTNPPEDVERCEAMEAIRRHQPEVVVGAFVAQLYRDGDADGNMYGPDEEAILESGVTYIHIGNLNVHKNKRILKRAHSEYRLPFIVTRAAEPAANVVWVWPPAEGRRR